MVDTTLLLNGVDTARHFAPDYATLGGATCIVLCGGVNLTVTRNGQVSGGPGCGVGVVGGMGLDASLRGGWPHRRPRENHEVDSFVSSWNRGAGGLLAGPRGGVSAAVTCTGTEGFGGDRRAYELGVGIADSTGLSGSYNFSYGWVVVPGHPWGMGQDTVPSAVASYGPPDHCPGLDPHRDRPRADGQAVTG